MRILVLLGLDADVRIPPERDARSGRVREEWLVRETDPASARALDLALELKAARPGTDVTVAHLGPPDSEPWLRRPLARGADRAIRVWDEEGAHVRAAGAALILAAAAEAAGFDLVLTGTAGVIDSAGQLGVLLAAHLSLPCVTQVIQIHEPAETAPDRLRCTRGLDGGFAEDVETQLPAVLTISGYAAQGSEAPLDAGASALVAAQQAELPVWDLADLGIPPARVREADRGLTYGDPRAPRARLHRQEAPDAALPAFERILQLVQGSVQQREGRVVQVSAEETVEEVFARLRDEGWLDHLRPGRPAPQGDDRA